MRPEIRPYDRAMFWVAGAAALAVIGGIPLSVGGVSAGTNLWANPWFLVGIAIEVVAALMLIRAAMLYRRHGKEARAVGDSKPRKKKSIRTGDINAPTTFGKNSPISIGATHRTLAALTPAQKQAITAHAGSTIVIASTGEAEAQALANEIYLLLRGSGWIISTYIETLLPAANLGAAPSPPGVVELRTPGSSPSAEFLALETVLEQLGHKTLRVPNRPFERGQQMVVVRGQ